MLPHVPPMHLPQTWWGHVPHSLGVFLDLRCILCFQQHHICFASLLGRSTRVPHPSARFLFALTLFLLFEFARLPTCVLTHKCQTLNDLMELRAPLIRSYRAVCDSHCTPVMNTRSASATHLAEEAAWPVCHSHLPALPLLTQIRRSASATHGSRVTCLPLPFACNSVMNTHKVFLFHNSLCGGGRVTCLPLPFAGTSVIDTHKVFRFRNSLCGGGRMTCMPFPFAVMPLWPHTWRSTLQLTLPRRPRDLSAIAVRRRFCY